MLERFCMLSLTKVGNCISEAVAHIAGKYDEAGNISMHLNPDGVIKFSYEGSRYSRSLAVHRTQFTPQCTVPHSGAVILHAVGRHTAQCDVMRNVA